MQDLNNNDNALLWVAVLGILVGATIPSLIAGDIHKEKQELKIINEYQAKEIDLLKAKIEGMLINE